MKLGKMAINQHRNIRLHNHVTDSIIFEDHSPSSKRTNKDTSMSRYRNISFPVILYHLFQTNLLYYFELIIF